MNRELTYRGITLEGVMIWGTSIIKRSDWNDTEKAWRVRYFLLNGDSCNQTPKIEDFVEVKPETVGQYTGLVDKNDQEIFEGDVVGFKKAKRNKKWAEVIEVRIEEGLLLPFYEEGFDDYEATWNYLQEYPYFEVIGNIYQSPELLNKI